MIINGEPFDKWIVKFMSHYKNMCAEIDMLKDARGKLMELQAEVAKLEKDVFGLKAIIPEDKLQAYELGREDKTFAEEVDKQLEKNDEQDVHQDPDLEQSSNWDKERIFGKK